MNYVVGRTLCKGVCCIIVSPGLDTFHTFRLHAYNCVLRMLFISHRSILIIRWMHSVHSPSCCGMRSATACLGKQLLDGGEEAKQQHAEKASTLA